MSSRPTTIELNGKRYDTQTGKIVQSVSRPSLSHATTGHGKVMDGVRPTKPMKLRSHHSSAPRKRGERSKTLMRGAVKKPVVQTVVAASPKIAKQAHRHYDISPLRASRAKTIQKSTLVKRFGEPQKPISPMAADLPVQAEPIAPPIRFDSHKSSPIAGSATHKKLFEQAVGKSQVHKQPKLKKPRRAHAVAKKLRVSTKALNYAAGSLATMLLVGFIAYQNVPNVSMRVATMRAGVDGRLPNYAPAGFGLAGPIQYQPGEITLKYASRSDDRAFNVSQRVSQWDSQSLLEQYVAPENGEYQTFEDGGKTIYVYDANSATWVDGGVWYQIEGNAALNNDQLLRMAASL